MVVTKKKTKRTPFKKKSVQTERKITKVLTGLALLGLTGIALKKGYDKYKSNKMTKMDLPGISDEEHKQLAQYVNIINKELSKGGITFVPSVENACKAYLEFEQLLQERCQYSNDCKRNFIQMKGIDIDEMNKALNKLKCGTQGIQLGPYITSSKSVQNLEKTLRAQTPPTPIKTGEMTKAEKERIEKELLQHRIDTVIEQMLKTKVKMDPDIYHKNRKANKQEACDIYNDYLKFIDETCKYNFTDHKGCLRKRMQQDNIDVALLEETIHNLKC